MATVLGPLGSQQQPRQQDSRQGCPAGPGSCRGVPIPLHMPSPPHWPPAPTHTPAEHPLPSVLRLPACFTIVHWRVFFKWYFFFFFFYLSDYILKGNLTAPLETENNHLRQQIEDIRTIRMKAKHVVRPRKARDLQKAGAGGGTDPTPRPLALSRALTHRVLPSALVQCSMNWVPPVSVV